MNLFRKKKVQRSARIERSTLSYNTSYVVVDENGNTHTPPIPDPEVETLVVTVGDCTGGFEVVEITPDYICFRTGIEYMESTGNTPKTEFICLQGEVLHLQMYGVCDAVHKVSIRYLEYIEERKR